LATAIVKGFGVGNRFEPRECEAGDRVSLLQVNHRVEPAVAQFAADGAELDQYDLSLQLAFFQERGNRAAARYGHGAGCIRPAGSH
jgi:hypothetical protein